MIVLGFCKVLSCIIRYHEFGLVASLIINFSVRLDITYFAET